MPARHGAWFAERVIAVKLEYGLSVDPAERDALAALLAGGGAELNCVDADTTSPDGHHQHDRQRTGQRPLLHHRHLFRIGHRLRCRGLGSSVTAALPICKEAMRATAATVTPAASGPVTVDILAGAAQDTAGNPSVAGTQFSIIADLMPVLFTDDPIRPGVTPVKAIHFTELRMRIDVLRREVGLAPFPWTDAALTTGVTSVKRTHLLELREALAAAYSAAGQATPGWTDAATPIKAVHLMELRAAVVALE